jgi:hypothetical protein
VTLTDLACSVEAFLFNRTYSISLCHTQQAKKTNKQASTEHAKSAYATHIKPKKQAIRLQQKMLNQLMSHTTSQKNKQKGLNRTC